MGMGCPSCLLPMWASPSQPRPQQAPGLTVQEALVRVRTQGRPGTPTPEDHGLAPQKVGSEAGVQLPTWEAELGEEGPATILPQWHQPAPTLPVPTHTQKSPTYIGAGKRTAGFMRAPPPPTFNTVGLQVEHVLGEREGGCHLGK